MKALIAGDWHGNTHWGKSVIRRAHEEGIYNIFQVGDFGLWPGRGGMDYLDDLNNEARKHGVMVYTLRGNHDWNRWEEMLADDTNYFDMKTGGVYVRSQIILLPRVAEFQFQDRTIQVVGGAVSIDKGYRTLGESWWTEEEITDAEVDAIEEKKVDILLTHDCSNRTPFNNRLKPDLDSVAHRQRIDRVLAKTSPELHFHGHMHEWYYWQNPVNQWQWTRTYGLNMDGTWNATGILDFDTLEFEPVN